MQELTDRNVEYFQEDLNGLTIQNQKGQWISHWTSVQAKCIKNDGLYRPVGFPHVFALYKPPAKGLGNLRIDSRFSKE